MWYEAAVATPGAEPVTLDLVKSYLRLDSSDEDVVLASLISAARNHLEKSCGVRFAARSAVPLLCDSFSDLARLPEAPVTAVVSISYLDTTGSSQTLATSVYEPRLDGLEPSIVLKPSQSWPSIQLNSRITVTCDIGEAIADPEIQLAILQLTGHSYNNRSTVVIGETVVEPPFTVNAFITNHRRSV